MGVYPKEPLEDGLGDGLEVGGEGHADLGGEQGLIVQLVLVAGCVVVVVLSKVMVVVVVMGCVVVVVLSKVIVVVVVMVVLSKVMVVVVVVVVVTGTCTQVIRKSIYLGAEHLIGFFTWLPSAQWYWRAGGSAVFPTRISILPAKVFAHLVLGPRTHHGAGLLRAEFRDSSVQHVYLEVRCQVTRWSGGQAVLVVIQVSPGVGLHLVEEVHGVDGHPLVDILALRQVHRQSQVPWICFKLANGFL